MSRGSKPTRAGARPAIAFRSAMADADKTLRLCALDNSVFADFLTGAMSPTPVDASTWSLYDLGGSTLRFTFTFFYVDGIASLPESSWPRLNGVHLVVGDRYVISMPDRSVDAQRRGRSTQVRLAAGAVAPTIHIECSLPLADFVKGLAEASPTAET